MAEPGDPVESPIFALDASRGFPAWLDGQRASLAFTTYQVGKVFFIGLKPDGKLWVFNRNVGRCLGLAVSASSLWLAGGAQIIRFENAVADQAAGEPDALYVPQTAYFTGDLDAHDITVTSAGEPVFANTRFNCLATVSPSHSFIPLWRPPYISRLVAEDRCHLNGVALAEGRVKYVTCVSRSDTFDGWREHRRDGGVVLDVDSGEIVCSGLSMPHSPRWHGGKLWLLNSGTGELGHVDLAGGRFVPLCFCPGYLRGLAFLGPHFTIVGLSRPREDKTFAGLALGEALAARAMAPRCGLYVIDLRDGSILHALTIEGVVSELYDVAVLPGLRQPAMVGLTGDEQARTISIG